MYNDTVTETRNIDTVPNIFDMKVQSFNKNIWNINIAIMYFL